MRATIVKDILPSSPVQNRGLNKRIFINQINVMFSRHEEETTT